MMQEIVNLACALKNFLFYSLYKEKSKDNRAGAVDMVSKERLVQMTESSIDNLIERFKKTPYFFYTENDLHTYLYHEIFSRLPFEEWLCRTSDDKTSILLHKEYPTKARYVARTPEEVRSGGARGHFDLCIWNPKETKNRLFRVVGSTDFENEQHTFIAIELDMIEGNKTAEQAMHHLKWDLLKLRVDTNHIEHGYSLIFVRDWQHKNKFVAEASKEASKALNTAVLYIEKDKGTIRAGILSSKRFLKYEPILE